MHLPFVTSVSVVCSTPSLLRAVSLKIGQQVYRYSDFFQNKTFLPLERGHLYVKPLHMRVHVSKEK